MSKIIGIDLGTSNSCVSVMEGGDAVVINNAEGKRTTPSIVGFISGGDRKVGDNAKRQAVTNSENTVSSIKRFMGTKYKDIESIIEKESYKIIDKNGIPYVRIEDKDYSPQEISAVILQKMKKTAEDFLGEKVTEAVITVPAYFNDNQRQATKEAGEIAGLDVKRIINEPTAASLSYGLDKVEEDQIVAVFDLGGGTFDISVLDLGDGIFEVKSTNGDTFLGGDDFDNVITDFLIDSFKKEYNVSLRVDPMALQRVKEAAEKAKIELSNSTETEINLPYIFPVDGVPKHLVTKITRTDFERLSQSLLNRIKLPCETAIKDAGLKVEDIDEIILVGGSTRIPAVQEIVKEIFKKAPNKSVNPDEAVSLGAAIQGGVLSGDVNDILLLDVTPITLGIETAGNIFTELIAGNTTIPSMKKQTFSTASDNQPEVDIHVLQGERPMARDNKTLGNFKLSVMPAPRGVPQIEVKFDIDSNGILSVSAKDLGTGKEQQITIQGSTSLSDEEINRMKKEAEENADADANQKIKVDKLNKADGVIFSTEKQMKDFGEKLQEADKDSLNEALDILKKNHKDENIDDIDSSIENLNETWNGISQKLYENKGQDESQDVDVDADQPQDDPTVKDEHIKDVDFDEVKEDGPDKE